MKDNVLRWYTITYKPLRVDAQEAKSYKAAQSKSQALAFLKKSMKTNYEVLDVQTEEFSI